MSYQPHPDLQTPPAETIIWRYMDLPKFLQMMEQGGLYFALLAEFTDKWEGVFNRQMTHRIATQFGGASGGMLQMGQDYLKTVVVNCWYQGIDESVAMWELYTKGEYGVAIKSTVGDLIKSLSGYGSAVFIGSVKYEDHAVAPSQSLPEQEITFFKPVLQKRICYQHECELRVITQLSPLFPKNPVPNQLVFGPLPDRGLVINVDLGTLVKSVTTGPHFPIWANDLLASSLARAGIHPKIVESNALKPPVAPFIRG